MNCTLAQTSRPSGSLYWFSLLSLQADANLAGSLLSAPVAVSACKVVTSDSGLCKLVSCTDTGNVAGCTHGLHEATVSAEHKRRRDALKRCAVHFFGFCSNDGLDATIVPCDGTVRCDPCLRLYLRRVHTVLILKMPVDETKRPTATMLKRVGPFEVLPMPQQTAAKTQQRQTAATASGSAARRLLAERTEVSEQPITT